MLFELGETGASRHLSPSPALYDSGVGGRQRPTGDGARECVPDVEASSEDDCRFFASTGNAVRALAKNRSVRACVLETSCKL